MMPKATTAMSERQGRRHNPLDADILGGSGILRSGKTGKKTKAEKDEEHFVNPKQSARILALGRELADDEEQPEPSALPQKSAFDVDSRFAPEADEDADAYEDEEAWGEDDEDIQLDEAEISPEDLAMFNKFMTTEEDPLLKHGWDRKPGAGEEQQGGGANLADLIMQKIQAFETAGEDQQEMGGVEDFSREEEDLPPKVVEVYAKYVASVLTFSVFLDLMRGVLLTIDTGVE